MSLDSNQWMRVMAQPVAVLKQRKTLSNTGSPSVSSRHMVVGVEIM
jgi:hypothetical protein